VVYCEGRPSVCKETVPVERVSLGTETVTEQQQVTADVSHEEIELGSGCEVVPVRSPL
jgi:stress response protein YsnF